MELIIKRRSGVCYTVLFDEIDTELITTRKWHYDSGYARTTLPKNGSGRCKELPMHRLLLGVTDPKIKVDHINHSTLDNRRVNLRTCTHQENLRNKSPWGSSKYLGVSKGDKKINGRIYPFICAGIKIEGKRKHIGHFKTEIEAARAYDNMAKIHFGEFANLNFPT